MLKQVYSIFSNGRNELNTVGKYSALTNCGITKRLGGIVYVCELIGRSAKLDSYCEKEFSNGDFCSANAVFDYWFVYRLGRV